MRGWLCPITWLISVTVSSALAEQRHEPQPRRLGDRAQRTDELVEAEIPAREFPPPSCPGTSSRGRPATRRRCSD